ncbi:GNAT family N-acetyltransferase [Cellulomonas sp. URHE0023]|uniref:GNAT family N-acetyltransferase n=1 Tax=Cellulomonas sp. URHE0023 TaxID=1380354 RepID=UPI000480E80B|nr:GNAT family N-acetyltransferase [Cellulomonas sp. URHE0023]
MTRRAGWVTRLADGGDVGPICAFGATHIRPHYTPLIGAGAADLQVTRWWSVEQIGTAVSQGRIVVAEAEAGDGVVGVAQRGWDGADHVIYKLYVDPACRGQGLGPRLIAAVVGQLPPDARRLCVEHFAGNVRAGAFYEREGFAVERVERDADDPALDVVWRARDLAPDERAQR